MRILKTLIALWVLGVAVVVVVAVASEPPAAVPRSLDSGRVVSDLGQLDMLQADQQMLQQMRTSISPDMATMIEQDPMWVDPDMIRLQEEYQAQLDRMIGRRPGQP